MSDPTTQLYDRLLEALAWYYDQVFDGTEKEYWVSEAEEVVGEILKPGRDARTKSEAVEALIWQMRPH